MSQISTVDGGGVIPPGNIVETLTGNTGGAVGPTGHNINVVGAGEISVAGNPGTSTLTISYQAAAQQVFFSAFKSATTANATGDATIATVIFDTAPFNVGAAYNAGTGIFTAPQDGLYAFFASVTVTNVAETHTGLEYAFTGSAEAINATTLNPGVGYSPLLSSSVSQPMSVVIQMTAGDTMTITATVSGDTKTVGIYGAALPGYLTWFRGYRIA